MRGMNYRELAFEVIRRFATDIPADDLKAIINKTYTAKAFGSDEITPLKMLEPGLHILGLSNGPTLAFKTWRCSCLATCSNTRLPMITRS